MKQKTETKGLSLITGSVFRIFGLGSIIIGIACLVMYIANTNVRTQGGRDLTPMLIYTAYCIPVGTGMIFLRKIFAVLIALPCLAAALWLGLGSILNVPFPWMLINIVFSCALCLPAYFTVVAWKQLR